MPSFRAAWLPFLVVACGGGAAATTITTTPATAPEPVASAAVESARVPHFVVVDTSWVRSFMRASDADVEAWAADPANAKRIVPGIRHILIRLDPDAKPAEVAAAMKRANAALARAKRGEDFAKLADELSDDRGTQRIGGVLPADDLSVYVAPFRDAVQALAPGEIGKQPVRTVFGLHVIKREALDAATKRTAYRAARAHDVAQTLAQEIARDDASDAIENASRTLLEEGALGDDARPRWHRFGGAGGDDPACARARQLSLANPSTAVAPLVQGEGFVVVKPMSAAFRSSTSRCASAESIHLQQVIERIRTQPRREP